MSAAILTFFTLTAFAANSLLCRMALGGHLIDPVSFTTVRLASGALVLLPLSRLVHENSSSRGDTAGSWRSGFALFAYAAAFSLAYTSLSTGTGALILFGAVQVTMIGAALKSGESLKPVQWLGLAAAVGGLVYLVMPGYSAPDLRGSLLMVVSGISWGVYSIRGRNVPAPVFMTAGNFARATPLAIMTSAAGFSLIHLEHTGVLLALVSGTVTSGLGYVLWYMVLRHLTTARAAVVQLLVPLLAAFGGVIFLAEQVSWRLVSASVLIIGGVSLAVMRTKTR